MTTRRLRLVLWQHRHSLKRQALGQERAAARLIGLADALVAAGRPEPARRLVGIALRFRVKAICLNARAEALTCPTGPFATSHPAQEGSRRG